MGIASITLFATSLGVALSRVHTEPRLLDKLASILAGLGLALVFCLPIILQILLVRSRLISWVVGLSLLAICSWIAFSLLTAESLDSLVAITSPLYVLVPILIMGLPIMFVLVFVGPEIIVRLLGFGFLSGSTLATIAILVSDAALITAGVPLILLAAIGGVVVDRSLRRSAAA